MCLIERKGCVSKNVMIFMNIHEPALEESAYIRGKNVYSQNCSEEVGVRVGD